MGAFRREAQCVPDAATPQQVARIFVRFMEKNPGKAQGEDTTVLTEALNEYFGCVLTKTP